MNGNTPIAIHGMVGNAEEERTRVLEWQDWFGKYKAPAFPLPHDKVYHLQSDDPTLPESQITPQTSGLNDLGAINLVFIIQQRFSEYADVVF